MTASVRTVIIAAGFVALAACGDGGPPETGPPETGPAETGPAADLDAEPTDDSDPSMPAALADFPLPEPYSLPFPPSDHGPDVDPRETLVVTVNSEVPYEEAFRVIDEGLEPAGYTVEARAGGPEGGRAVWEFEKDGLPGGATLGENPDFVVININLYRAGVR